MKTRFLFIFFLLSMTIVSIAQKKAKQSEGLFFSEEANSSKAYFLHEQGKHMKFFGVELDGCSMDFWKKLEALKAEVIYDADNEHSGEDCFGSAKFVGEEGWKIHLCSTQGKVIRPNEKNDTIYNMYIVKSFTNLDTLLSCHEKVRNYISESYPFRTKFYYFNKKFDYPVIQIKYVTPYGDIFLHVDKDDYNVYYLALELEDEINKSYLKENITDYSFKNISNKLDDTAVSLTLYNDDYKLFIFAKIDGFPVKIEARDNDYKELKHIVDSDDMVLLKDALEIYMEPYMFKFGDYGEIITVTKNDMAGVLEKCKEKKQQRIKQQKYEDDVAKAKAIIMYQVFKAAANAVGSTVRNTPTIEEQYKRWGY